jgi:periplasmic protein TonB
VADQCLVFGDQMTGNLSRASVLVLALLLAGMVNAAPPAPPVVYVPSPPPAPLQTGPESDGSYKAMQIEGWISDEDYPAIAIRNEESGTSVAQYTIGVDGKVTNCMASGSGSAVLDETTCRLIKERFRFRPALDPNSRARVESKAQRITWRLPENRLQLFDPEDFQASFTVGADGNVSNCVAIGTGVAEKNFAKFCEYMTRSVPGVDKDGKPVARRVRIHSTIESENLKK